MLSSNTCKKIHMSNKAIRHMLKTVIYFHQYSQEISFLIFLESSIYRPIKSANPNNPISIKS